MNAAKKKGRSRGDVFVCVCVWEYTCVYESVQRGTPLCCDCSLKVCDDIVVRMCDMPLESVRRGSFICVT